MLQSQLPLVYMNGEEVLTSFNNPGKMRLARVVSSEEERFLDAEEVAGSSPAPPTIST
ncbi:MAG: hypothetical protein PWP05_611 [Thermovirga sp.]|nr:MAG: hypothetical protein XD70_0450 [Thermovirga lienii]MDN5318498.1 hypothetical protein [Thermovirga sp.]MDN5367896.1 hypothetical protein [Thermovirga sp.]